MARTCSYSTWRLQSVQNRTTVLLGCWNREGEPVATTTAMWQRRARSGERDREGGGASGRRWG